MDKLNKRDFFEALQRLNDLDDFDDESDDSLENILFSSRPSRIPNPTTTISASPGTIPLQRSHTDPQAALARIRDQDPHINNPRRLVEGTEPKERIVRRAQTMPVTQTGGPPTKKRKTGSLKLLPENQQIFKGLSFFFLPNNDIAPSRRLRIQRAREYGAQWAREWSEHITHVIVDRGLLYQDLLTHVNTKILPVGSLVWAYASRANNATGSHCCCQRILPIRLYQVSISLEHPASAVPC
jgi:DNA polymerase IV